MRVAHDICHMTKKKLCYILETLSIKGGLERVMTDKMNYLAREGGYDVTLVEVYDYGQPDAYELSDHVKRVRLGIRKKSVILLKPMTFWKVVRAVSDAVDSIKPDIISSAGLLGVILFGLKKFEPYTIYESHGPRHRMLLQPLVRLMEKHVDHVVTLTDGDRSEYRIVKRTTTIMNGIIEPATLPCYHNRDSHEIVALGRLSRQKGFDMLIHAYHMARQKGLDKHLTIYGDGTERQYLESLVEKLDLKEYVTLHPALDDIEAIYSQAHSVVISSVYEGFCLVALESMAHGIPVIACDVKYGPKEVIEDNGIVIQRNVSDMADAMMLLSNDDNLYEQLSQKGRQRALDFEHKKIMMNWHELYSSVK